MELSEALSLHKSMSENELTNNAVGSICPFFTNAMLNSTMYNYSLKEMNDYMKKSTYL